MLMTAFLSPISQPPETEDFHMSARGQHFTPQAKGEHRGEGGDLRVVACSVRMFDLSVEHDGRPAGAGGGQRDLADICTAAASSLVLRWDWSTRCCSDQLTSKSRVGPSLRLSRSD